MTSDTSAEPGRRAEVRGPVRDAPAGPDVRTPPTLDVPPAPTVPTPAAPTPSIQAPAPAIPPSSHAPHRFWLVATGALIASALAWVSLVLWGGGSDMRRGLLTGGSTLTSMDGAGMGGAGMDAAATSMPGMSMPNMHMAGGGDMSMLGVSMTGKEPASVGYAGLFLWMWAVMILAMMLPAIVPSVRSFLEEDDTGARTAGLRFVTAVTAVWVGVGTGLYAVLAGLNALLPDPSRVAVDVGAVCVLLAGLFQFSRTKERMLSHVSGPFCCSGGPWRAGLDHGRKCVVSCGPYMVAVALIGMMNLAWMGLFALVMVAEQVAELVAGKGMLIARGVGAVVVVIALGLLLAPGPLPLLT